MGYITSNRLAGIIDLPLALAATALKMGDWLVVAPVSIVAPMRLTYSFLNLQIISSSVNVNQIVSPNLIYGNLGLVYLALQQNYAGGSPGAAGALDAVVATGLGLFPRVASPMVLTTPGTYSWVLANNMQPTNDSSALLPTSTSIDFNVSVTGSVRLELSYL